MSRLSFDWNLEKQPQDYRGRILKREGGKTVTSGN